MSTYPFTQADQTDVLDCLANDYGSTMAEKAILEKRLSHFFGHSWDNPAAVEICKELDTIDAQLKVIRSNYDLVYQEAIQ